MYINNKRILFFSPRAFGYEIAIKRRMEDMGAYVDYYDDRPSNGFWGKALLRVYKGLVAKQIHSYYKEIQGCLDKERHYDIILLLNLEAMPIWFLQWMKIHYGGAKIVLYMWDSFRNKVHTRDFLPYCDRAITFDSEDLRENPNLEFRPLFYVKGYKNIAKSRNFDYEVAFVATAHSDRYIISEKVKKQVESRRGKMFSYMFLQSKKLFLYLKLTTPTFRKTKAKDFNYRSLSTEELIDVISRSRIVLDVQHPKQTGLTMRTIEMIGAERKLITTNAAVKKYDFYNPNNIYVIDRDNPYIDPSFFEGEYEPISKELYYKYSLDGWLEYVLGE